jgi:hypothetical protein
MSRRRIQATVPEPYESLSSLRASVLALKELVETLAGQRGQAYDVAVTWGDLLDANVVKIEQVPQDIGSRPLPKTPKP